MTRAVLLALALAACGHIAVDQTGGGFDIRFREDIDHPGIMFNRMDTAAREQCPDGYEKTAERSSGPYFSREFVWSIRCL